MIKSIFDFLKTGMEFVNNLFKWKNDPAVQDANEASKETKTNNDISNEVKNGDADATRNRISP